jgi:hypothetical protein
MAIALAGVFQVTDWFMDGNVFVEDLPLGVGESKTLSLKVTDTARPLNILLITYPDTPIAVELLDPANSKILSSSYSRTSQDVTATVPGTYTLVITNDGRTPTLISAALRQPEFSNVQEVNSMFGLAAGSIGTGSLMIIISLLIMIAGGAISIIDRRKKAGMPASSRQI